MHNSHSSVYYLNLAYPDRIDLGHKKYIISAAPTATQLNHSPYSLKTKTASILNIKDLEVYHVIPLDVFDFNLPEELHEAMPVQIEAFGSYGRSQYIRSLHSQNKFTM